MSISITDEKPSYLTFTLGKEVFAVDISQVREVVEFMKITKVSRAPDFIRGAINLGGMVIPVIDLKLKFGMGLTKKTIETCIVIMEVHLAKNKEPIVWGALSDSLQEVIEIDPEHIEPASSIGTNVNTEFIKGMGKRDGNFIIILDIDKIFKGKELKVVKTAINKRKLNISKRHKKSKNNS